MTKALPTHGIKTATPRFIDKGGVLRSLVGGKDQRLDRPGSKWGVSFKTRPMKIEDARVWAARLLAGQREKASIRVPQPGLVINQATDYSIGVAQLANAIILTVHAPNVGEIGKVFKEGQFITLIRAGIRYVHQIQADTVVDGAQNAALPILPELRVAPQVGDVVEVLDPKIEGYVGGDSFGWDIDDAKIHGFSFDIEEAQ